MNNIRIAAAGCLLLMSAMVAPATFAHNDTTSSGLAARADNGAVSTSVAGWYYGSASAWVSLNAATLATLCPTGAEPECAATEGDPVAVNPGFTLAAAYGLCDLEVLSDGTATNAQEDEEYVESTTANGGDLPDGLFDDGGVGAVCHTPDGYYGVGAFNENGCPTGDRATASDAAVAGDVWVSATCDSTTPSVQAGLLDHVFTLTTCLPAAVLSGVDVGAAVACVSDFVNCGVLGTSCPSTGATFCGGDGVADASAEGKGNPGPLFPGVASGCTTTASSQSAFVWNAVGLQTTPGVGVPIRSVATTGWVA